MRQTDVPPQVPGSANGETDERIVGVVVVACSEGVRSKVSRAFLNADYSLSVDPVLSEALVLVGPQGLRTSLRHRGSAFGSNDAERIRKSFESGLLKSDLDQFTRVVLGVIVVDYGQNLETIMMGLRSAPQLTGIRMQVRGIRLTPISGEPIKGVTTLGPDQGLDALILRICEEVIESSQSSTRMSVPAPELGRVFSSVKIGSRIADEVEPARMIDQEESAAHANQVAIASSASVQEQRPALLQPSPQDPYMAPGGIPLRLTYLVIANGAESKPKNVHNRIVELVVDLDRGLTPHHNMFASKTRLVAAGQGDSRRPIMRDTGSIDRASIWKPSSDFLDMTKVMRELLQLVTEDIESCQRRGQKLRKPLVLFVLPDATMSGERCLNLYRSLKERVDIGWLITDKDAPGPNAEVDGQRVVTDKFDVVNELLYKVGYPQEFPVAPSVQEEPSRSILRRGLAKVFRRTAPSDQDTH
jgi:hypothetical protein